MKELMLSKTIEQNLTKLRLVKMTKVVLCFDNKCLFKCKHCYLWNKNQDFSTLSLQSWLILLEEIHKKYGERIEIYLGGDGMVLLEDKLIPILNKCKELNFKTFLSTNAYLVNKKILNRLIDSGLDNISISIDFLTPKKHDAQRGVQSSFLHIKKFLEYLETIDIGQMKITFNCIIMKPNLDEIIPLTKWVNSLNPKCTIGFQAISQPFNTKQIINWYESKKYMSLWPGNENKVYQIIDDLIFLKNQKDSYSYVAYQLSL